MVRFVRGSFLNFSGLFLHSSNVFPWLFSELSSPLKFVGGVFRCVELFTMFAGVNTQFMVKFVCSSTLGVGMVPV